MRSLSSLRCRAAALLFALSVFGLARGDDVETVEPPGADSGPSQTYVDFDRLQSGGAPVVLPDEYYGAYGRYLPSSWLTLPRGLVYENYLAGTKESRLAWNFNEIDGDGTLFDATVGARIGLFRYGDLNPFRPEGFQVDAEGSAQLRLDPEENVDLHAVDFRGGLPITYGRGRSRWKFGYYHTSAHLGDEFLLRNPGYPRLNYSRDVLLLGYAYFVAPRTRIYAEAGWAFYSDVSEPWEFQFGIDHAPFEPTGPWGAPFWAVNGHLHQEVDFGGALTAQAGWAWRSDFGSPLLRAGVQYYNGQSNQYSFYHEHEEQIGLALWYDF